MNEFEEYIDEKTGRPVCSNCLSQNITFLECESYNQGFGVVLIFWCLDCEARTTFAVSNGVTGVDLLWVYTAP